MIRVAFDAVGIDIPGTRGADLFIDDEPGDFEIPRRVIGEGLVRPHVPEPVRPQFGKVLEPFFAFPRGFFGGGARRHVRIRRDVVKAFDRLPPDFADLIIQTGVILTVGFQGPCDLNARFDQIVESPITGTVPAIFGGDADHF
ncbi:MAG: hypothetical protein VW268_13070 [Rhodospirillaceae bacterium]